ncbi:MAG: DUF3858 domain-containing protein [bacterium]|nr:DUF3858 domain-containing protein [bacterium]
MKTDDKKRKHPFRTRSSQQVEVKETLKLPGGFKLINPGKLNNVDGSGASFTGNIQQKGNTVFINKKIKLKKRIYQPKDWKSFRESVLAFKKPKGDILIVKNSKGGKK